jgi:hypothetical protein
VDRGARAGSLRQRQRYVPDEVSRSMPPRDWVLTRRRGTKSPRRTRDLDPVGRGVLRGTVVAVARGLPGDAREGEMAEPQRRFTGIAGDIRDAHGLPVAEDFN